MASVKQLTHDGLSKTNLLSDGSHLYVTEWPAGRHIVAKVSLDSDKRSVIATTFPNMQALDVSPDGANLLISPIQGNSRANEFWTLPLGAGSPKRVGELTGRDAAWANDGHLLVFGQGSGVFVANADGSSAHLVYSANGSVFAPHVSPDGKKIRFSVGVTTQNTTSLWEVGVDGSNPHPLLPKWSNSSAACCGSWTGDGRYYIFQVTQTSPATLTTLWAMPGSGGSKTEPFQLTSGPMSFGNASPSANGKLVWAIGVQPAGQAVKYIPAQKRFTPLLAGVSATDLDFSADGQWVAYVSIPDGELWRCRADGSEKLRLTSSPERAALPRWSPDGGQIAYVRLLPGEASKIAAIPAVGGTARDILVENASQIDANWSNDGNRIMFGSFVHDAAGISIRIVDLNTHKVEKVPGSEGLFSPRWSPDGRYIAALSPDFTNVMLFDFETQKWSTWLTEAAGAVSYPSWSPDSRYLYFDDQVTEEESIRRVKVGENHTEQVFKLEKIERYPGEFGLWTGRAPDGSWMFVRDHSTQEVYQLSLRLPESEGR